MADVILTAEPRSERGSGPAGRLRRAGKVPAVVYGLGAQATAVTVGAHALDGLLRGEAGTNTLITLRIDGDDALALVRQIQRHPTRGDLVHVDFVRVRRDVAVSAEVPLHLVGEGPGIRAGGLLEQSLFHVTVEAMPQSIPTGLEVDVAGLDLGDQLHTSDIPLPAGVTLAHEGDELVVQVVVPRGMAESEEGGEEAAGEGAEAAAGEASSEG